MPWKTTVKRARRDKRQGKAPTTQAGEFVKEEMEHIRRGKHGARSPEQAIAIGLSKARRAGVKLGKPPAGTASAKKSRSSKSRATTHSAKRSRAREAALKREGRSAASHSALSRHSKKVAHRRSASSRSASARKAARTRKHASA